MDLGLQNKVALVAASSSGLGFAAALALAREGAKVVVCGRNQARVDQAVQRIQDEIGAETAVAGFVTDVTAPAKITQLVADTVTAFGGIDILITNAGGPPGGTFDTTDIEAWESAFHLTLMSATRLIKESLPYLRRSNAASILTITSFSTKMPVPGLLLSNVYRPAVVGLTKTLSLELAAEGIRVNSILPGWTATERLDHIFADRAARNGTTPAVERKKITDSIPLQRMATPAEFGKVATFLVSSAASYVTGTMMLVDGGDYRGLL